MQLMKDHELENPSPLSELFADAMDNKQAEVYVIAVVWLHNQAFQPPSIFLGIGVFEWSYLLWSTAAH